MAVLVSSAKREPYIGFLGERGGFHPVLVLNNGEQKDLALFAYSRRDSARTYVQLNNLCTNGPKQSTPLL